MSAQYAKALFAYAGQEEDELSFKKGDIIEIIEEEEGEQEEGWSLGCLNGEEGIFPTNYIEMIEKKLSGATASEVQDKKISESPIKEETRASPAPTKPKEVKGTTSEPAQKPKKIGKGWYEIFDSGSSRVYYVHKKDKRKQWTWPDEVPREAGADPPPAHAPPSKTRPISAPVSKPPIIAPPSKERTVATLGPRPDFSAGVSRKDRCDYITAMFFEIDEEYKAKTKEKPIWRTEGTKEIADFAFMKTNKIGIGARRQFRLDKNAGKLTLRKKNKDTKQFYISRVKACEKVRGNANKCQLVFGQPSGRGSGKKKQRPYELIFETKRLMNRFIQAIEEMIAISQASRGTNSAMTRNFSTYNPSMSRMASTNKFANVRNKSFMSMSSLSDLSSIDMLSESSTGAASGGDVLAETFKTSFKIMKTNKLGITQERILEFVPLAASARKDVNAEGGQEMRVSTLRGEKKKGFDVDFITSVEKDKSNPRKLDIIFGAPFYYSMIKTLAYINHEQQRPYLLEFVDEEDRSLFTKSLLRAQSASRESYRHHEMQKKAERLRDMNTTLWHVSYKSKGRWEPHELFWRASSGVVSGRIAILASETQEIACRFDSKALKELLALDQSTQPPGCPPTAVALRLRAENKGKSRNLDLIFVDHQELSTFVDFSKKNCTGVKVQELVEEFCEMASEMGE